MTTKTWESKGSHYQGDGGSNNYYAYLPSVQPGQQITVTGASFHNAPAVPGTVNIYMQMTPSTALGQQGNSSNRAVPGGQSSVGMGSSYGNFRD